jgi:excisionase family DNA binding protein
MRLLDVEEVASVLGVGRWRVYELARAGVVPHVRLGRSVRFSEDLLRAWIEAGGSGFEKTRSEEPSRDEAL